MFLEGSKIVEASTNPERDACLWLSEAGFSGSLMFVDEVTKVARIRVMDLNRYAKAKKKA